MNKTISQASAELREAMRQDEMEETSKLDQATDEFELQHLAAFEEEFSEQLPLLMADGIGWSYHMNDKRYTHMGGYMLFCKDGKELRMDFNGQHSYRYEYVPYRPGLSEHANYCTMVFARWPKDRFILFIDEKLLQQK